MLKCSTNEQTIYRRKRKQKEEEEEGERECRIIKKWGKMKRMEQAQRVGQ